MTSGLVQLFQVNYKVYVVTSRYIWYPIPVEFRVFELRILTLILINRIRLVIKNDHFFFYREKRL